MNETKRAKEEVEENSYNSDCESDEEGDIVPTTLTARSGRQVHASSITTSDGRQRRVHALHLANASLQTSVKWFGRETSHVQLGDIKEFALDDDEEDDREWVAVFHAATTDGRSMVRALVSSSENVHVVAIVRVPTSTATKELLQLPRVKVKVADLRHEEALQNSLQGVQRAFWCLPHWEYFENDREEEQALSVLKACSRAGVGHVIFSTFEDTQQLKAAEQKSQLVPDKLGRIQPDFTKMKPIQNEARLMNINLTHMITSYLDQEKSKRSLCVIRGQNGTLIVQTHQGAVREEEEEKKT
mmetsp:Transcript_23479/g.54556  ORF Transcript_23479/g.54556 Transcript_23479/m.54556 type:complete len:300 (+) Transcript_23479:161-1060(+)|eukprot:CAMPEP_0116858266 /NCGR_PEP_ID=MMETSP0418-20121206/21070_1 /TAXON_ID=1158023 /ORGANISM="Astrosyne radiata, Strain 13vi08-1A" /LENGTH=299 /DNA_ID=CAMNT_0004492155 /DNA_START=83 /DNA_END=982 /DNA_ORIENTATION=+